MSGSARRLVVLAVVVALVAGCRRKPAREWRADDHDEEPSAPAPGPGAAPGAAAAAGGGNPDDLVDATWTSKCAECHGVSGQGNGPKAAMTKPPNLADPALLGSRTDEQLANTIRTGKGKMPAFGTLPPSVIAGLIRRIRTLGGE
ncbi:MAG: cytochrome c [Deltaproteobacteria bacterium]|nr:cytochrome c [Deltaproteobacteria bacterium]